MLLPYGRFIKYPKRLVVDAEKVSINEDVTGFGTAANILDKEGHANGTILSSEPFGKR